MKKKRVIIVILLIIITIAGIIIIPPLVNPLRGTNKSIRKSVLSIIPIGTSMEDVIKIAEEKWGIRYIDDYGLYVIDDKPARHLPINPQEAVGIIIGKKRIEVRLGEYYSPFKTTVLVFFAFNENDKLIDVFILKETDAM